MRDGARGRVRDDDKMSDGLRMSEEREEFLKADQVLGNLFRVGKPFAAGGYAVVYLAEKIDDGSPVVIKALRQNALQQDPAAVDRFVREGAVATRVKHPNVVKTLQFGQTLGGILYIAMEFLKGKPLEHFMLREPIPAAHVQKILDQLLKGLEAIHALGVVHRDLKPSNVFLCDPPSGPPVTDVLNSEHVKLLDFGFVKFLENSTIPIANNPRLSRPLTLAGDRVGTPGYMAPETLLHGVSSAQGDLYSLGLIGYEMITGKQAFPGKGVQRAIAQLNSVPAKPPRDIAEHPIYKIIQRLIEVNTDKRYASATQALQDLSEIVVPEEIEVIDTYLVSGELPVLDPDALIESPQKSFFDPDSFKVIDSFEAFDRYQALEEIQRITADEPEQFEDVDTYDDLQSGSEIEVVEALEGGEGFEQILTTGGGIEVGYIDLDSLGIEVVDQIHMGDTEHNLQTVAALSPNRAGGGAVVAGGAQEAEEQPTGAKRWLRFLWSGK